MKTIVVGDTHGRKDWQKISQQSFDKFVFIGDYVDTHESITPMEQVENLREIIMFKQKNLNKVVLLIGNHDYHYWPTIAERYSGYQPQMRASFEYEFSEFGNLFQATYEQDDILFSHAGVTKEWCKNNKIDSDGILKEGLTEQINELFEEQPRKFGFYGYDPYGDNITQGPFWVRPRSLMKDAVEGYKQIIGHTTQNIIYPRNRNEYKDQFWFIDTLGTSGEYLVIEDDEIKVEKCEK